MSSLNKILVTLHCILSFCSSVSVYVCKYHNAYNVLSIIANLVMLEDVIYFDIQEKKLASL